MSRCADQTIMMAGKYGRLPFVQVPGHLFAAQKITAKASASAATKAAQAAAKAADAGEVGA